MPEIPCMGEGKGQSVIYLHHKRQAKCIFCSQRICMNIF